MKIDTIHNRSCGLMPELADDSIDQMVTDPPYAIGFMGKEWDKFQKKKPTASQVVTWMSPTMKKDTRGMMEFFTPIWRECLRILKPGAFAFVMCIPRQDCLARMIISLEDAGFVVSFSSMVHAFACLSEDTEILTQDGWKLWEQLHKFRKDLINLQMNDMIMTYDTKTDQFKWELPSRWQAYKIKDICYRIRSNFTDQLVSTRHRCFIEQEGRLLWECAERLSKTEKFPILDNLQDLSEDNFSSSKEFEIFRGLLNRMSENSAQREKRKTSWIKGKKNKINMSCLWKKISEKIKRNKLYEKWEESKKSLLLTELSRKGNYLEFDKERQASASNVQSTKTAITRRNDGREKLGLERWSNLLQNTWELCGNKICSLSERIFSYGSQGWLCYGAPLISSTSIEQTVIKNRSSTSQRPRSHEQCIKQFNVVSKQSITQESRRRKSYETTLATISKQYYEGVVFCPTVSTGCFVARRKGKIFLTGNSGFPKAMSISKAVDKRLGAKRKVIGQKTRGDVQKAKQSGTTFAAADANKNNKDIFGYGIEDITLPATPQAQALDGSYAGFQPKPAVEVVIVAMKPLSEKTYVDQALRNGKGVSWLGNGRIPYKSDDVPDGGYGRMGIGIGKPSEHQPYTPKKRGSLKSTSPDRKWGYKECVDIGSPRGRFPANLLVSDDALNDGKIRKNSSIGHKNIGWKHSGNTKDEMTPLRYQPEYADSGSFSRYFSLDTWFSKKLKELPAGVQKTFPFLIVPKASKSEKNRGCEGLKEKEMSHSTSMKCANCGLPILSGQGETCKCAVKAEIRHKMKNYHPTVKPLKLMSYLITLGSRPGDVVLDPFLGSGTTAVAAKMLKRHYIGYEIDEGYVKIAEARLSVVQEQLI